MGFSIPLCVGGFSALHGGNLVNETEQRLRPGYGEGLYGGAGSGHEAYRRGVAYGHALSASHIISILVGAVPGSGTLWLAEWEQTLGLGGAQKLTAEQRQTRILARIREIRGTSATSIEDALKAVAGGDYFTITNPDPSKPLSYLVQLYNPITPTNALGLACIATLWRMTPAHVTCFVEYPDLSIAPAELGA